MGFQNKWLSFESPWYMPLSIFSLLTSLYAPKPSICFYPSWMLRGLCGGHSLPLGFGHIDVHIPGFFHVTRVNAMWTSTCPYIRTCWRLHLLTYTHNNTSAEVRGPWTQWAGFCERWENEQDMLNTRGLFTNKGERKGTPFLSNLLQAQLVFPQISYYMSLLL